MNNSSAMTVPTRRRVLQTLVGAGGLLVSELLPGMSASAITASGNHLRLLDLAATTTALGMTFYQRALTESEFVLGETGARQLESMLVAQQKEATQLREFGGKVLTQSVLLPHAVYRDASVFVQTGLHMERASTQFYLSATRDLAAHNMTQVTLLLARLAAHASQRQVHLAHLAGLSGEEAALSPVARSTPEALGALSVYLGTARDGFQQVAVSA